MSGILRQDIQQILALASQIKTERTGTVDDLLRRLRLINQALNDAWDGASQDAFTRAYGNWIDQLEKFSDTMYSVEQYLTSVAREFDELDRAAAAAASGAATST